MVLPVRSQGDGYTTAAFNGSCFALGHGQDLSSIPCPTNRGRSKLGRVTDRLRVGPTAWEIFSVSTGSVVSVNISSDVSQAGVACAVTVQHAATKRSTGMLLKPSELNNDCMQRNFAGPMLSICKI